MGGGEPGDLLLRVTAGEKPGFERKGMGSLYHAADSVYTAALGGEATVQTIYGNVLCKIRKALSPGSKIRPERQGHCFHEGSFRPWRPVCEDRGSGSQESSSEARQKLRNSSRSARAAQDPGAPAQRKSGGKGNKFYEKRSRRSAAFFCPEVRDLCSPGFLCII